MPASLPLFASSLIGTKSAQREVKIATGAHRQQHECANCRIHHDSLIAYTKNMMRNHATVTAISPNSAHRHESGFPQYGEKAMANNQNEREQGGSRGGNQGGNQNERQEGRGGNQNERQEGRGGSQNERQEGQGMQNERQEGRGSQNREEGGRNQR
jgi:hypothetical protein